VNNNTWFCETCGHMNVSSSTTCNLCKQLKRKSLIPKVRIIQKSDPEIMFEKANQTKEEFNKLHIRLEKAKKKLEEKCDSVPPTGTIKIIVPNNWTGIVITAIVVTALVTLIVLIKLFFK
jgi:recombinational DNA repair protein RecR